MAGGEAGGAPGSGERGFGELDVAVVDEDPGGEAVDVGGVHERERRSADLADDDDVDQFVEGDGGRARAARGAGAGASAAAARGGLKFVRGGVGHGARSGVLGGPIVAVSGAVEMVGFQELALSGSAPRGTD